MSAVEQRKLLEQLMGAGALDSGPKSTRRSVVDLNDPKICKSFLVDFCIHDLFTNTKQDLGPCPKVHQEKYKLEYIAQKNRGVEFPEFDEEFERDLAKYVMDCNRRIEAMTRSLAKTPEDIIKLNKATEELEIIDQSINLQLQEIGALGAHCEVTRAFYEHDQLESKRFHKEQKEREIRLVSEASGASGHQKLQVCEQCGAYLSRLDNDKRLADHFMGKMHKGYVQMRAAYNEIKEKNDQRRRQNDEKRKRHSSLRY